MSSYNTRQNHSTKLKPPSVSVKSPGGSSVKANKAAKQSRTSETSPTKENTPVRPPKSDKDSENRYVCSVCNNTDSIQSARLKLETDLLSDTVAKIDNIKLNITNHASQIENLDLHIQHLLLNPEKFENYQDCVADINKKCSSIKCEIDKLQQNGTASTISTTPMLELCENDIIKLSDLVKTSATPSAPVICENSSRIATLEQACSKIAKYIDELKPDTCTSQQTITHEVPSPTVIDGPLVNPCDHILKYAPNFVNSALSAELYTFLENENFYDKNGRSVATYGKPYKYNGSHDDEHKSSEIPVPIQKLISEIESEFHGEDTAINSCHVNRYTGEDSFLPPHSYDESIIKPQSLIFSISIGATANIQFKDNLSNKTEILSAEDKSLYIMTQQSQHFWTHQIKVDDSVKATRYSITFRCVGDEYKKSTVIIGDSNTRHLAFGTEKKTFGKDLPGKRILAYNIEDIAPNDCIGYQNIVVHVGVNNLKSTRIPGLFGDTKDVNVWEQFKLYEAKINTIRSLCPNAILYLSPALPTKIRWLNHRILEFDSYINSYVCANVGIRSFNFNNFADNESVLRNEFTSYKYKDDNIHLGSWGIITFARKIKSAILKPQLDGRSFSSVVKSDDRKSHSSDSLPS